MDDKTLLKVSWASLFIGLTLLAIIGCTKEPQTIHINEIEEMPLQTQVALKATVATVNKQAKYTRLTLKDTTGQTTALLFERNLPLEPRQEVTLTARIDEYKGQKQLQILKIES